LHSEIGNRFQQPFAINAVYELHEWQRTFELVALHMPDEVPMGRGNRLGFLPQFLRSAFAEVMHSQLREQRGDLACNRFGNGDQSHVVALAIGASARFGDRNFRN